MKQNGFTLIEIMVSLAVGSLVLMIATSFFINNLRGFKMDEDKGYVQSQGHLMVLGMREIDKSGYDPLETDLFPITEATNIAFTFAFDKNENGALDADETIRIYFDLSAMEIRKTSSSANSIIAGKVSDLTLSYVYADGENSGNVGLPNDADGDTTNDFADIREIIADVELRSALNNLDGSYFKQNLMIEMFPHNLRF